MRRFRSFAKTRTAIDVASFFVLSAISFPYSVQTGIAFLAIGSLVFVHDRIRLS